MVEEEHHEIMKELSMLSGGQRKILIAITEGFTKGLMSKIFLKKINMTNSSVSEILKIIEQRDYFVKKSDGEFQLIDPLISTALRLYFGNDQVMISCSNKVNS